jgi:hypothetical protein
MKSNPRCLLILTVLVFLQAVFFETYAQTGARTPLNISIAGVEYDDASFIKLKKAIKNNKKVQDLKQTFSDNTARISLSYTGDATELWDEIPVALKQAFKVTSIETNGFDLQLKNTAVANTQAASSANTNPVPVSKAGNDDCKNCYWNMCTYDLIKSIGGKVYKGMITEYGTVYYNCDNGIVLRAQLNINDYGSTVLAGTDTVLISSGPVGTKWGMVNVDNKNELLGAFSGQDFSMKDSGHYTLIAKNITTEVSGKSYRDVIVVNYKGYSKDPFFGTNLYSTNYYYAKGIGLIRTDTLNFDSDPLAAINKHNDPATVYSGGSVVRNGIDATLVGLWKYHDPKTNTDSYYRFKPDGTFEFYSGSVSEVNKTKGINTWKIEEGGYNKNGQAIIDLHWAGAGNYTMRNELQKKDDPATKKPALLLNSVLIVSVDKKSW